MKTRRTARCFRETDPVLAEDLDLIASDERIEWSCFRNSTILVTGATGFFGSLLVKALVEANLKRELGLRILADVRSVDKARKVLRVPLCHKFVRVVPGGCREPSRIGEKVDYIFHTVAVTTSKMMVDEPYETAAVTLIGTQNMLDFARENAVKGMVYLSSMEVYGIPTSKRGLVTEDKIGYLNPLLPRSSYPESKRMAECLCAAAAHEYGTPVTIARLAQTFGAGISKTDTRVFAQFARAIMSGSDIVLRSDGSTQRCYCYSRDAVVALLMLATKGQRGEAYNIANEKTFCSIREMAERVIAASPACKSRLVFDIADDISKLGYLPKFRMRLSSRKMRDLGWKPSVDLETMYARLIASFKSQGEGMEGQKK